MVILDRREKALTGRQFEKILVGKGGSYGNGEEISIRIRGKIAA